MPLTNNDAQKLIKAGFTIIRADYQRLVIKYKGKGQCEWKDLEKGFLSRAGLERRMKELLKNDLIIND